MTKLAQKVLQPIACVTQWVFTRWLLDHLSHKTIDHDPSVRAGEDRSAGRQRNPGLCGVLVSTGGYRVH